MWNKWDLRGPIYKEYKNPNPPKSIVDDNVQPLTGFHVAIQISNSMMLLSSISSDSTQSLSSIFWRFLEYFVCLSTKSPLIGSVQAARTELAKNKSSLVPDALCEMASAPKSHHNVHLRYK